MQPNSFLCFYTCVWCRRQKFINRKNGHKIIKIDNKYIKNSNYNNTIIISCEGIIDKTKLIFIRKKYYSSLNDISLNSKGFIINNNLQHSIIFNAT